MGGGGVRPLTHYIHIHMIQARPDHVSCNIISSDGPSLKSIFYLSHLVCDLFPVQVHSRLVFYIPTFHIMLPEFT